MIKRLLGSLQATRFLERIRLPARSANNDLLWRDSLREMARHFPPSGAELRLLSIRGTEKSALQLLEFRPDIRITGIVSQKLSKVASQTSSNQITWISSDDRYLPFADNSFDAIAVHLVGFMVMGNRKAIAARRAKPLTEFLRVLRPGGRLIMLMTEPWGTKILVDAGFARVFSENILHGYCELTRGEKPYTKRSTVERIAQTAARDDSTDGKQVISPETLRSAIKGKFIYLLVRQLPDKPAWALKPDEPIRWRAAMINDVNGNAHLLAFSSLNKAVEFMQAAVTNNAIHGINKVAKYPKAVIPAYGTDLIFNPRFDLLCEDYTFTDTMLDVDPHKAVTGEE